MLVLPCQPFLSGQWCHIFCLASTINTGSPFSRYFQVFQKLRTIKEDIDVARAPKVDENHYYGVYYRFGKYLRFIEKRKSFFFMGFNCLPGRMAAKSTSPWWRLRMSMIIMKARKFHQTIKYFSLYSYVIHQTKR